MRELWPLERGVIFLNHGSFGACPAEVLRQQAALRDEMEAAPVRFLSRELDDRLASARQALPAFVGADPDDLAFVANATGGVNAVLRSLRFSPGDELLTTDHAYNACRNALDFAAGRAGARVLVDGAHAPGMVPLDLGALGAAYYSGNCHKWLCAPKGSAFLWVRRDRQPDIRPLTISHGASAARPGRSRFRLEFDWTGTDDPTAWLAVPGAIEYLGSLLPGGWPELMARNRALALEARRLLCAATGTAPPCPEEMVGALASIILPDGPTTEIGWRRPDPLQRRLYDGWDIEVPVMSWPAAPRRLVRISAQLYNAPADFERLAEALRRELAAERDARDSPGSG